MKKIVLLVGGILFAAAATAGEGAGEWDFLAAPPGVRCLAMGGAGTALGDDHATGVLNPAGLGRLNRGEASFAHHEGVESISRDSLGIAWPTEKGTVAGRWSRGDYGSLPGLDSAGNSLGDISAQENWFQISGGHSFRDRLCAGASLNHAERKLHDQSTSGAFADVGVLARVPAPKIFHEARAGFSVRRIGFGWPRGEGPPRELRLGLATGLWDDRVTVAADLVQPQGGDLRPLAGIEYASGGAAFFRVGYDHSLESSFSYGVGFRAGDVTLDYAFAPMGDLGNTNHLGLTWRFGNPAEAYYEKGLDYFRQEDYARAVVNFNRALSADPHHAKALLKLREANQKLQKKWDDTPR